MAPSRMETKPVIFLSKTSSSLYSFIFWVTGAVSSSVGLWWKFMLGPYTSLISSSPTNAPYASVATGAAIISFGLFGCFATCRGRPWMSKSYAVFLSSVFMTELIAGISGFIFRHEIKGTFSTSYSEAVMWYNSYDERSMAVDNVQRTLQCCGVQNYTSWLTSVYFPGSGIPASCCVSYVECSAAESKNATSAARKVYRQGCYDSVVSFIENNMGIIAGVTFGIAFSQVVGLSSACCSAYFITTNQYEMV